MERLITVLEDKSIGAPSEQGHSHRRPMTSVRTSPDKIRYDMYLTDRRIVVAVLFSTRDYSQSGELITLDQGISAAKASMNFGNIRKQRREEFAGRTPDDILHLHPDRREVTFDQIQSIQLKKGIMGSKLEVEVLRNGEVEKLSAPVPREKTDDVNSFLDMCPPDRVAR